VSITPDALAGLCAYDWPGNIRELENVIERAIVLAHDGIITAQEIQPGRPLDAQRQNWVELLPVEEGFKPVIAAVERALVERALRAAGGNKTEAAEILKIHRRLLYEKMREHGVS
jgi:DNA-binding NtrC family response regulator